ncbi:MAG: TM0996/MTH895 family glutaredoxin-like protein [Verrucomicrobiae bacterium]|nr:TM0996/MTH895 family glutaredoxin-like protein [Verrucomicrobiae bacterium]
MKKILVLGPGCTKCKHLHEVAEEAAKQLGLECEMEKVTDIRQIMALRVMMTPALVVDGAVKVAGRVPNIEEMKRILQGAS